MSIRTTVRATVETVMLKQPTTLTPTMAIHDAMQVFTRTGLSGAPVVDDRGQLIGMLSEKDCIQVLVDCVYKKRIGETVADYMVTQVETITHDTSLLRAAELLLSRPFRQMPVMRYGNLVGLIRREDVMRGVMVLVPRPDKAAAEDLHA